MHCLFMSFAQFSNKVGFFLMTSIEFVCFIYQLQIFLPVSYSHTTLVIYKILPLSFFSLML